MTQAFAAGDRAIDTNVIYPTGALFTNSGSPSDGRVINVMSPPTTTTPAMTGAVGDGKHDDTAALQSIFNFVKTQCVNSNGSTSYIMYFPNGTYLVSDTIFYTGAVAQVTNSSVTNCDINQIHIVGQSRAHTLIQLADNSAGFNVAGTPKAVLRYCHTSTYVNPFASNNLCENLAINTGTGNSNAIGIQFQSANSGMISNVSVTAGDGTGFCGIYLSVASIQAYMKDVTVTGFNTGVYCLSSLENDSAWEHLTCVSQHVAGVTVVDGGIFIRDLFSQQSVYHVPGLTFTSHPGGASTGGNCSLVDSWCYGGSSTSAAIVLTSSTKESIFVRNTQTTGYGTAILTGSTISVRGPFVSEYTASSVVTLADPQDTHSFAMPVQDTPTVAWDTNMNNWVNVEDYRNGTNTDNVTVANAFAYAGANNKTTVYFPRLNYPNMNQQINVPPSVTRVEALFSTLGSPTNALFNIATNSASPVLFDGVSTAGNPQTAVNISAARTIITRLGNGNVADLQTNAVSTFIEACRDLGKGPQFCATNQNVWARCLNAEYQSPTTDITSAGGRLWVMGYKTENKPTTSLAASGGGVAEVVGGYVNTVQENGNDTGPTARPVLSNTAAQMCFNGFSGNYFYQYTNAIYETQGTNSATYPVSLLPLRGSLNTNGVYYSGIYNNPNSFDIPLYVGGQRPTGPYGIFTASTDIGTVAAMGSADNYKSNTYFVDGSGTAIGGTSDSFQYLSTGKTGDATVTAEVFSVDATDPSAESGVMIRDGTASTAMFADVVITPADGVIFEVRTATGGSASTVATNTALQTPYYVRLVRSGNNFTASTSPDGSTWTQLGSTTAISIPSAATAGLCVTAHNNSGVICRSILNASLQ